MDELGFALLSCKLSLKTFAAGSTIYTRGSPSDFAYIIVCGAIKVHKNF
jgi:CRP-like cAMP-binding protein